MPLDDLPIKKPMGNSKALDSESVPGNMAIWINRTLKMTWDFDPIFIGILKV